jgi:hypothetical protein
MVSSFVFAITLFLHIPAACGDALSKATEADAKRIAPLIKPGDVLLYLCRTCNTFALKEGDLTARRVISVEAIAREKPLPYASHLPYHVIVTQDLFFAAESISESKDRKEITATGRCMVPFHYEIKFRDQQCLEFIGDSNVPYAFRCREGAYLNYTYFQKNGVWQNFATVSLDDKDVKPWADTVKLNPATWQKIEQCRKAYESGLQKAKP